MPLDTQTFGMSRYWLTVALDILPRQPELLTPRSLCEARKAFLAGKNQITAIRNWLVCAEVIEVARGQATLTDLGKLIAAQDPRAERAWTWWLVHLHLCANKDACPYCTLFHHLEPDGRNWWKFDDLLEELAKHQSGDSRVADNSVRTYFEGIEQTLRPTWPTYGLGLVERRRVTGDSGKERIRRRRVSPDDLVVLYATVLFQYRLLPTQATVEARQLLKNGLGGSLGMRDSDIRDAFLRIHQDSKLGELLHYTQTANLDSLEFPRSGPYALKQVRAHGYHYRDIRWP